ncbi:Bromodomain associated-domain-containing protein [Chaetomium sp. MPI-SDFR-AT-0129]|nr:Bromodomain associated-domain-containing protein [Chaetomium sp. MPI-SDFR-AT-0129]
MSTDSRKRSAETALDSENGSADTKRQRVQTPHTILSVGKTGLSPQASSAPTREDSAVKGLRRTIALTLEKVGFDGAAPEAMESFTAMTEAYLLSLAETVKTFGNIGKRQHPIPTDFEVALKRFNLTTSLLDPHRKPPIPKSKRKPTWEFLIPEPLGGDLPILGEELDGAPDKAAKQYIPAFFPAFPSIHTYKCTPESVDAVTVSDDWGLFNPDTPSQSLDGLQPVQPQQPQRPLAADEIPYGDPKKMREAAAKEAKAGEGALRRLMRASKIAKQKEVWSAAQRQPARRDRYKLWESAMQELIEDDIKSKGKELMPTVMYGDKGRFEIADHSMLVNTNKACLRQDIPRAGVRKAAGYGITGKG